MAVLSKMWGDWTSKIRMGMQGLWEAQIINLKSTRLPKWPQIMLPKISHFAPKFHWWNFRLSGLERFFKGGMWVGYRPEISHSHSLKTLKDIPPCQSHPLCHLHPLVLSYDSHKKVVYLILKYGGIGSCIQRSQIKIHCPYFPSKLEIFQWVEFSSSGWIMLLLWYAN